MIPFTYLIACLSGTPSVLEPKRATRFDGEGSGYGLSKHHGDGILVFRIIPDADGVGYGHLEYSPGYKGQPRWQRSLT